MENYSVLMTVYCKEKPEYLEASLQSMMLQTIVTDDFVVVCDGPLTPELDKVLEQYVQQYPGVFNIIRLPENVGIGAAANVGLHRCKNELVAKMDADDISVPQRCEKQLRMFERNHDLTVQGGFIEEFNDNPEKPFAVRCVPESNAEIRKFARRRQPFNNMTVMYRRSAVLAVGGYRNFRRNEDYDLYLRLLHHDFYAGNLPETLVKARVDAGAFSRRASWATLKGCAQSRWYAFRIGYSSLMDFLICVVGQFVVFASPVKLQHLIYQKLFRRNCGETGHGRAG